jgi:hypothetical protein
LKSCALPPMAACKRSPIESSLRRMADLPKLATRRNGEAEVEDGGLHWAAEALGYQPTKVDPRIKAQIQESSHGAQ